MAETLKKFLNKLLVDHWLRTPCSEHDKLDGEKTILVGVGNADSKCRIDGDDGRGGDAPIGQGGA